MLLYKGSKLHPHPPNNSANHLSSYSHDLKVQKANRIIYFNKKVLNQELPLAFINERNHMGGTDCNTWHKYSAS